MDVSTRKLRYFVAVAEELHFSRAAARLFVAQQALSRQVRELEEAVGTTLLRRTTRFVELTPAGEVLLAAARHALATIDEGVVAARRTGCGEVGTLTVGFEIGAALELTAPIMAEFARRHPDVELRMQEYPFSDTAAGLADGSSDVAFNRLPIAVPDVDTVVLFVEPLVAIVPLGHRLATRAAVTAQDLVGEPMGLRRGSDETRRAFWTLAEHTGGAGRVVETRSHTEELELVAAGLICSISAAASARATPHRGVRFIPIDDVPGSTVAVGWRRDHRTPLVEQFIAAAAHVRDTEHDTVHAIEHPFDAAHNETG